MIPPGGEGKVTLKVNLKGYQGSVKKSATVFSNDPQNPTILIAMQGMVKALIELQPSNVVSFRGVFDQAQEKVVDIVTTSEPFHINKTETDLNNKISYSMETIEAGKHYRLKVSNLVKQGNYSGYIKCFTDMARKPEFLVPVSGFIEGEVSVRPQLIRVGKLFPQRPVQDGKVLINNNRQKSFQITKLTYNENLVRIAQQPIPNEHGYILDITPILDNVPSGTRVQQTLLVIETDANPAERYEVRVEVVNER